MANKPDSTFRIRLKSEIKKRLDKLAKASGRDLNSLISYAVEPCVAGQERMFAELRQAERQVKSGHYIRHDDMKTWVLSWGTDHELSPPECVCGRLHDDLLCR